MMKMYLQKSKRKVATSDKTSPVLPPESGVVS